MGSFYVTLKTRWWKNKTQEDESERIHDLAHLINIRKYSPRHKYKILCPDLLVLLCTSNLVSSFSPYQQYQKIYWVEIWNRRTENKQDNIIKTALESSNCGLKSKIISYSIDQLYQVRDQHLYFKPNRLR